eukprot:scaffold7158_cov135-Skeletonema_dohrnii-CCMP3373.AAC.3
MEASLTLDQFRKGLEAVGGKIRIDKLVDDPLFLRPSPSHEVNTGPRKMEEAAFVICAVAVAVTIESLRITKPVKECSRYPWRVHY